MLGQLLCNALTRLHLPSSQRCESARQAAQIDSAGQAGLTHWAALNRAPRWWGWQAGQELAWQALSLPRSARVRGRGPGLALVTGPCHP